MHHVLLILLVQAVHDSVLIGDVVDVAVVDDDDDLHIWQA